MAPGAGYRVICCECAKLVFLHRLQFASNLEKSRLYAKEFVYTLLHQVISCSGDAALVETSHFFPSVVPFLQSGHGCPWPCAACVVFSL